MALLCVWEQGLDETWQKEVDVVDERMKESLRSKAQLNERDVERINRAFLHELQQLQSMRVHFYSNVCLYC